MVLSKVAILLAAAVGCAEATVVSKISPPLDHDSSDKFFKKDYPWDKRPTAGKEYAFGHPYPVVQDSGHFDTDYVKDENSDNGSWQAQMEYDTLRAKLRKELKQAEKAKTHKEEEFKELEQMKKDEKHAEEKAAKARADAQQAKGEADQAKKEVEDLDGSTAKGKKVSDGTLESATDKVKKETSDLEKCKKELEEAKKKLENLVKEKEDLEKKEEDDIKKANEFKAGEYAKAMGKATEVAKKHKEAKAMEESLESDEVHLKKAMEKEHEDYVKAQAEYEKTKAKVAQTKAQLENAENKVRVLRGETAVHHSPAVRPVAALMAVLVSLACAFSY